MTDIGNTAPRKGKGVIWLKNSNSLSAHIFHINEEGEPIGLTVQITDVTKPLCAVGRIADAGNQVILDQNGGYIENVSLIKRST